MQRNGVSAVIAHNPLGLASGAGGIKDIERIGCLEHNAVGRLGYDKQILPADKVGFGDRLLGSLPNHHLLGLVFGQL